jgi:hypothetical protein
MPENKGSLASKEPSETGHSFDSVYSQIWSVETGAGHVQVSSLERESKVIPNKPMSANVCLKIKLESAALVWRPYSGGCHTGAQIGERDPARARGKVIAQMGRQSDQFIAPWRELAPAE